MINKKKIKKLIFSSILILLLIDNVYAAAFQMSEYTAIALYAACGLFVLIGIIIIIKGKNNGSTSGYYEEEKHDIPGLTDKKEKKPEKDEIETNTFNSDSIFKIIPTFSPNKLYNDIFNVLNEKILEDKNITKTKLYSKSITNFENENDVYKITVKLTIEETYLNENNVKKMRKSNYEVIASNTNSNIDNNICPICGGKIKDPTLLRCTFCNSILPKIETNNSLNWNVVSYKKID